jgi:hypothetical protein
MIAAFVLIVGNADCTAIVQTLVTGLYPESVVGILKSIIFGLLTAPLTCNCSWGVRRKCQILTVKPQEFPDTRRPMDYFPAWSWQ